MINHNIPIGQIQPGKRMSGQTWNECVKCCTKIDDDKIHCDKCEKWFKEIINKNNKNIPEFNDKED